MKFGMLYLFENPAGRSAEQMVLEQLELMQAAETYGFDSVWPAEHHFSEYGMCGSPVVSLAALARTTKRIRLGTGVVVLPFNHPVRVAEDFAMLDILSGGRVELGVGRGYQPTEFRGFGIDPAESTERFDESLEVLRRAWTHERLDFDGKHYRFEDVEVRPKPLQKPHPPLWLAAISDDSFEKAGRLGMNLLCAPVFGGSLQESKGRLERYHEALRRAGHDPADHEIGALVMVYAGRTQEVARREFGEAVMWYFQTWGRYVAPKVGQPALPSYEGYTAIRDAVRALEWEQLLAHGAVVCGEADYVGQCLEEIRDTFGIQHLLCWTRLGGLGTEQVKGHMQRVSERVIPALR